MVARDLNLQSGVAAKHTLHVKVYYFPDSGATPQRIVSDVKMANDIFAQVGVRGLLKSGYPKPVSLPEGQLDSKVPIYAHEQLLPNADAKTRAAIVGTPSVKGRQMIEVCDRSSNELSIIYCSQLLGSDNKATSAGYAYVPSACSVPGLSNSAFVSGYIKEISN